MTQTFKSVHFTNNYHKTSGGISTVFNNLLAAAANEKRFMRLVVPGEQDGVEEINEFARIYYIRARRSPVFDTRYRIIMPWKYIPTDSIIRNILLEEKPDMIEVADKYSLSSLGAMIRTNYFQKLGRPMLVNNSCERMDDNMEAFVSRSPFGKWFARRFMSNYLIPSFDFHLVPSAYIADEYYLATSGSENPGRSERFYNFCLRVIKAPRVTIGERVRVASPGYDDNQFSIANRSETAREKIITQANAIKDSVILFYAGRLSPEKNTKLLIETMRVLAADDKRDFRLLIGGEGPQNEWLAKESSKHLPGKVVLMGHLDKQTLAKYYSNCDVFIHPNPREPFGIGPLEAMASGTPLVAPNTGGIRTYANDENAWIVEPTGESFASAVREIIENEKLRNIKIANALESVKEHTAAKASARQFAIYDELLDEFQRRNDLFTDRERARKFDFVQLADA